MADVTTMQPEAPTTSPAPLDVERIRSDFPILERQINGHPLVYLDSAATSQKPRQVIEAVSDYYWTANANVHRGVHTLAGEATDVFENARARVARFIGAADPSGIVFVRNTTEGLNLVAASYAGALLTVGDRVVLSEMEHHSNLVPWQLAAARAGFDLAVIRTLDDGTLDMDHAAELINGACRLVAVTHQSNVLGTINDVRRLATMAHANDALICVDGAQSVPHMPVNVADLDCDFLAFSGHKMLGPMGIGVLWARPELLDSMPPFLGGGSMIMRVKLDGSSWNSVPHKFEAGTPDVAGAAGLAAACDYLDAVGLDAIHRHERALVGHLLETLGEVGELDVYGPRDLDVHGGSVSFNLKTVHAHDVGTILDREGVEVRAGHHCCQPLMRRLGVSSTARASVYLYTTHAEIDALGSALGEVKRLFGSS